MKKYNNLWKLDKWRDQTIKIYRNYILIFSIIGLIFSSYLILLDYLTVDYCPKIFFIPACYLVFLSFSFITISETIQFSSNNLIFFIGNFLGLFLGIWFSYNEIIIAHICPRLYDIPLCYPSLFMN